MNGRIIHSPLHRANVHRVLDVGCGTGVVTDYLATQYASADVIGLDLSPVPKLRDRPKNVRFLQGNILTEKPSAWKADTVGTTLPDAEAFDLIYSRLLVCGMSAWPQYISTAFSLLRPDGYLEIHDLDWVWFKSASATQSGKEENLSDHWPWWQALRAAGEAKGLDFTCGSSTQHWMKEAGFVDVKVQEYRWPWGGEWEQDQVWKDFGQYVCSAMVEMVWHMIPRVMGDAADDERIAEMRASMKRDFAPEKGKVWKMYVSCGRRPG